MLPYISGGFLEITLEDTSHRVSVSSVTRPRLEQSWVAAAHLRNPQRTPLQSKVKSELLGFHELAKVKSMLLSYYELK